MATYYARHDGTAANKAAATGPADTVSACMSIATFNGETFSANDVIIFSSRGGDFTVGVVIPSSGTSGNLIVYKGETGHLPTFTSWASFDQNDQSYIELRDLTCDCAGTTNFHFSGATADPGRPISRDFHCGSSRAGQLSPHSRPVRLS